MNIKSLALVFVIGILFVPLAIAIPPTDIYSVKDKYKHDIISIEGVTGLYADQEANQIVVFIEDASKAEKVPKEIEGFKVRTEVTGKFQAYKYSRTGVNNPIFGGISLGSQAIYCSSGTLGIVTKDNYILSNAHVLALDYNVNFVPGNPIWQPGGADTNCGSTSYNVVGNLVSYIPIVFNDYSANNYADAAISNITNVTYNIGMELNKPNNGFYTVSGMVNVSPGDSVRKSGRTTGVTNGKIVSNNGIVQVWYSDSTWAIFDDQIIVTPGFFSKPGDSGSVVDKDGQWAGLLFAGNGQYTIVNKPSYIANGLGIHI